MKTITAWLKKISDIFTISSKPEPPPPIKYENSVSFIVDEWNRLIIKVRIENTNSSSCEAFGKMLFFINFQ